MNFTAIMLLEVRDSLTNFTATSLLEVRDVSHELHYNILT